MSSSLFVRSAPVVSFDLNKVVKQYPSNIVSSFNHEVVLAEKESVAVTTIQLESVNARCCIDTGAGKNYISRACIEKVGATTEKTRGVVVTIADSTSVACDEVATLSIELEGRCFTTEFYVLDRLLFDCIIGCEFCRDHGAVINLQTNRVRFTDKQPTDIELQATEQVTIPGFSEMLIDAKGCVPDGKTYFAIT